MHGTLCATLPTATEIEQQPQQQEEAQLMIAINMHVTFLIKEYA